MGTGRTVFARKSLAQREIRAQWRIRLLLESMAMAIAAGSPDPGAYTRGQPARRRVEA